MPAIIALIVLAVIVFAIIGIYNGLVTSRNQIGNSFSQIDVQLTRRYDLIPNLVETAKAYMAHEKGTLEAVITARNAAQNALANLKAAPADPTAVAALSASEGALGAVMTKFMALAEAYPDLKANQNMMQVSEELTSTENRVAFARQAYNDSVLGYNNRREVFPNNIIAGMFNFVPGKALEIDDIQTKRESIKVNFN
jgi:LemA protein